jgi:Mg2+/Co2+ transporter CorB
LDDWSTGTELLLLVGLLIISAFFSIAETSMMALNRFRLRAMARLGNRNARRTLALLERTDQLLGVILLGNNLVNAAAATLTGVLTVQWFGEERYALALGTLAVTFAILVFSEITPKVIGAAHAERIALPLSHVLAPLLRVLYPVVGFINLFVSGLLWLLRMSPQRSDEVRLSPAELRALVLEHSRYLPKKHQTILGNLFDLENVTVGDVMVPRAHVEVVDIDAPPDELARQMMTSYHTRLVACHGNLDDVAGLLHVRRVLGAMRHGELDRPMLVSLLTPTYFVPGSTPVLTQLQYFQERRERLALVVDEYGEVQGLVTLEDIVEEFIGEFTTGSPMQPGALRWGEDGSVLADGGMLLRELNRQLALSLPVDGPRTLNGLVLEQLQDIPESGVSLRVAGVVIEIVATEDRAIRTVRLFRPASPEAGARHD